LSEISGTAPADFKPAPTYRGLRALVIGLGVLMVLAFGAVIAGLFTNIRSHEAAPDRPAVFTLTPGAKIDQMDVQNDRLVLHVRNAAGDEIDIIDTESGRLVGQVKSAPEPVAVPEKK
jgi:Family of unknown function (DUF6476)